MIVDQHGRKVPEDEHPIATIVSGALWVLLAVAWAWYLFGTSGLALCAAFFIAFAVLG